MEWMFERTVVFAALAVLVACVRYGTYFYSIYLKQTKPHAFSWLLWGVMVGIGALAQFELEGGASAYALAFVAISCLAVAVLAVFIGEKHYTKSDWLALGAALCAIPLWKFTESPILALAFLIVIDCLSYYPTFRKTYAKPDTEPPISYFWAGLRYFLILFAVPNPSWETLIYPFFLMASDWGFAVFIVVRRWQKGLPLQEYARQRAG